MAECTGATVNVDFVVGDAKIFHCCHRYGSERFVDFKQIHCVSRPAGFFVQLLNRTNRRCREPTRFLCMRCVSDDFSDRCQTEFFGFGLTHQHQRCSAIVDGGRRCSSDCAVFFEGWLQSWDFVEFGFQRAFVFIDHNVTTTTGNGNRCDFPRKRAVCCRCLRTFDGSNRKCILIFAAELVFGGAIFGKSTHGAAFVIGVFETVEHHVIVNHAVADTIAAACLWNDVRCVSHRFHTAGDHHFIAACADRVKRHHGCLHRRAAHFGQSDRACGHRQTCRQQSLTCRCLTLTGHQAVTEQNFFHQLRLDTSTFNCSFDCHCTELTGGQGCEITLKCPHRGTGCANDYDRVCHVFLH